MSAMKSLTAQSGIALLEAFVSIAIVSVGMLAAVRLQMKAVSAMTESNSRATATLAAEELLGIVWNDQANAANYATGGSALTNWSAKLAAAIPGATATVAVVPVLATSGAQRKQITITINWQRRAGLYANTHRLVAYLEPAR
jgi:type IV pilus assembly protein PilV